MSQFAQRLIDWHRCHGRHDLPWQEDWRRLRDPYRVWLSEIMLQQTQVATVVAYYARFLQRFPALSDLAAAELAEVMPLWSGLGYYARARNLHACAQELASSHAGRFPHEPERIAALPGIGRSTANAIAVFCFGARAPILDGNVKRVLSRFLALAEHPGTSAGVKRLWSEAERLMPEGDNAIYIQAQMDLGATVCTRTQPRCEACPVADLCVARRDARTAELPIPRARKAVPEKAVTVLVLRDAGLRILLERRPPSGIWGGLLALPELPAGRDVAEFCHARLGVTLQSVSPASTFRHAFSHFRLVMQPLVCTVAPLPGTAEPGLEWIAPENLAAAALPSPARKILHAVSASP